MSRRAVFLCAGRGTRAEDITGGLPKCMLRVGGRTIIDRALSQLHARGIDDVHVLLGHRADLVAEEVGDRAQTHSFADYASTNNLWTMAAHAGLLRAHDCAVLFGDVLLSEEAVDALWASPSALVLLVDRGSRSAGTMRIRATPGGGFDLGQHIPIARADGNFIGVFRSRPEVSSAIADDIERERAAGRGRDAYVTSVLPALSQAVGADLVDVPREQWAEVDTAEDHDVAESLFGRRPTARARM